MASTNDVQIARRMAQAAFDTQRELASEALQAIQRAATRALDEFANGYIGRTDFISQHAAKYAEALARMDALSSQLAAFDWLLTND